ncbi:methionine adenosyltransferase, partial [Helicobacter pylori]
KKIGSTDALYGFDYRSAAVLNGIGEPSPDINPGVVKADGEIWAGAQGLMFGYAGKGTETLMPFPIHFTPKLPFA